RSGLAVRPRITRHVDCRIWVSRISVGRVFIAQVVARRTHYVANDIKKARICPQLGNICVSSLPCLPSTNPVSEECLIRGRAVIEVSSKVWLLIPFKQIQVGSCIVSSRHSS